MNIEMVKISALKPAEYNPRVIDSEVLERLKKGIQQYGLVEPLVINADGTLIGGHQRLKASQALGMTEVPCVRLDLDKKHEKALNVALNKLSGDWDFGKLSGILAELAEDSEFDLDFTGFGALELTDLADGLAVSMADIGDFDSLGLPGADDGDDAESGDAEKPGYTIQYTLVFNDEREQDEWHKWLRRLRDKYPDMDTISERILAEVEAMEEAFGDE